MLTVTLRRDQAVAQIRRAERLDPLNLMLKTWVAIQLSRAGRNDEAMEQWDSVLDMDPDFALATYNKGLTGTTSEPELDPLREHPRFRRLRSAMGLP